MNGHTYAFYSVATDNVGNVQPTPTAAQASTVVQTQQPTSLGRVWQWHLWRDCHPDSDADRGRLTAGGKTVAFTLTSGGNVTSAGQATTDASGVATLGGVSLAGLNAGTFTGPGGPVTEDATDGSVASGDLVVNPAQATLSLGKLVFTYDGTPHTTSVSTNPAGLNGVTVTYTQSLRKKCRLSLRERRHCKKFTGSPGSVAVAAPTHAGS